MSNRLVARQGDVLVFAATAQESKAKGDEVKPDAARGVVLAYGELSGHAHVLPPDAATLFAFKDGDRLLKIAKATTLRHTQTDGRQADHAPIDLPKGNYVVRVKRVYRPEGVSRVED